MFTSGLASLDGKDGLANIPGISQTPAFQHDQIIAMDGHYLLGFGPRAAKAVGELAGKLHNRISK
jgi:iron complex transport system substrate-binding protein